MNGEGPRLWRILVLHGPNLELTGRRQPEHYGSRTLAQIDEDARRLGESLGARVTTAQYMAEEDIIAAVRAAVGSYDGIVINPAVYTHTSPPLGEALREAGVPYVEVHMSNPYARETSRHISHVAGGAVGRVMGFKGDSYLLALRGLIAHLTAAGGGGETT